MGNSAMAFCALVEDSLVEKDRDDDDEVALVVVKEEDWSSGVP